MSELYDDERPPRNGGSHDGANEGVRILGAEEARASLADSNDRPEETDPPMADTDTANETSPTEGPSVSLEEPEPQLDLRDPSTFDSEARGSGEPDPAPDPRRDATWSAGSSEDLVETARVTDADSDAEPPTGEVPPLPHWTEPATGAVPAIFADDTDTPDELDAWATVTGAQPRFRAEGSDWSESDFSDDLSGQQVKLGALSNEGPVDEDAAFERDLAARRPGPSSRAAGTATTRRSPRSRSAASRAESERVAREAETVRDLPTAIMTGAAVAVVAIVCFVRGERATVGLAAVIIGVATLELASSLHRRGMRPATLVALVASTLMPIAARAYGTAAYPVFFGLVVIVSMLWFLLEITPGRPLPGVATTVLVFAYVGGLGGFAGLILASNHGVGLVLGVALCVISYDVLGFFVGSQFGHTAIAPRISPNKTIEGTVAGMAASIAVGALIVSHFSPWTTGKGLVLGVLVAAGAFVGDLCESMLKRDLGLKDFGSLLPGHGGVLDRFDALLFCLPIAYYLALQFKIY